MPQVPFSTYTLNNDNAECGYILVFDCSLGNFVFRNPCDLLNGCEIDVNNLIDWDTFNWCNMVDSPLLNNMEPGHFLRVNLAGTCIEGVDPTSLSWLHDYRVRVTDVDTEEYLLSKIVGTTGRVSVNLVPGAAQKLKIDIIESGIDGLLPPNPSCIGTDNPTGYAQLVYDNTGLHWECQQNRMDTYWHQRFVTSDIIINSGSAGFPVGGVVSGGSYWFVNTQGTEGLSSMGFNLVGTTPPHTFPSGTLIPAIRIQETGLYAVRANVDVFIEGAINAIRFFLYTSNTKTMIVNMKEGTDSISVVPAGSTGLTKTFSGYNLVKLNKGEYIFMGVRVFTPTTDPFKFTIYSKAFPLDVPIGGGPSGNLCGTTFGCMLVSKSVLDSS